MPPPRPKNIGRFTTETPPPRPDFLTNKTSNANKGKIHPKFLKPLKERVSSEEVRQILKGEEFGDMEYAMEMLPEFTSSIGRLGFSPSKTTVDFYKSGETPETIGTHDPSTGAMSYIDRRDDKGDLDHALLLDGILGKRKDTPAQRALYAQGSFSNPENFVIEHESIHRGLYLLHQYWEDDADGFIERYGEPAWNFLQKAAPINMKRTYQTLPYVEAISTLNDGIRSIKNDPNLKGEDKKFQYDRYMSHVYTDDKSNKRILNKIFNQALEVLPELEEAAIDRLIDEDSEGVFDDAQNMPEVKAKRKGAMGRLLNKLKFAYRNYKSDKDMQPIYEEASKNMPDEFAKGGMAMDKQMRMAFMDNGGLQDDGMDRDPVSGNDVPSGSLAEEVRDDIPAQLSEGEYVVPADVVRFFGVKFFEDLRMQAKMGLAQMERSGRIGGEPIEEDEEMLNPDDEALIIAMTPNMNEGGVVKAAEGVDLSKGETDTMPSLLSKFSFVGQSLFPVGGRSANTQKTWFHPDGRSHVVTYDENGNVTPITDTVFTQPPWSLSPPEGTGEEDGAINEADTAPVKRDAAEPTAKAQKEAEDLARIEFIQKQRKANNLPEIILPEMQQDFYKNRQQSSINLAEKYSEKDPNATLLVNQFNEVVQLPEDNYKALLVSFNRVKGIGAGDKQIKTLQDYYELPLATRAKLGQFEWKTVFGKDLTDEDKVKMAEIVEKSEPGALEKMMGLANVAAEYFDDKFLKRDDDYVSPGQQELLDYQAEQDAKRQAAEEAAEKAEAERKKELADEVERRIKQREKEAERRRKAQEAKTKAQKEAEAAKAKADKKKNLEQSGPTIFDEKDRFTEPVNIPKPPKDPKPPKKEPKGTDKYFAPKVKKGVGSGFALDKGGLASKPKPNPKKKRTTKGLGTKPKAT